MTNAPDSLSRLTLRQLRQKASALGVPLYSRKSKVSLIKAIEIYQAKKDAVEKLGTPFWKAPSSQSKSANFLGSSSNTKVVFLPRDPEWAYVFWEIAEVDRQRALSLGASRLSLRLADVTDITDGTAHPHTLQEVQVDSHSTEWYLPIPLSDRDYRVELGYRSGTKWISLAFSSTSRVPSLHPSDQILDQFVPFSLDTKSIETTTQSLESSAMSAQDIGLHERLYQTATTHFRTTRIGSEEFHENGSRNSYLNDSGIGLWASGRSESGVGGTTDHVRSDGETYREKV